MVSSEKSGMKSHKSVDAETPFLMRLYYTDRNVLFCVCAGNEFFFMLLYCLAQPLFQKSSIISQAINTGLLFCGPIMAFKQYMNFIQMYSAAVKLAEKDWEEAKKIKGTLSGRISKSSRRVSKPLGPKPKIDMEELDESDDDTPTKRVLRKVK